MKGATTDILKWMVHTLLCALFVAVAFTFADFHDMPMGSATEVAIKVAHWGMIAFVLWITMLFLALTGKWVFTVSYAVIVLLSSILTYFRYDINFSFNATMLNVALNNDLGTTSDMITSRLVIFVILSTAAAVALAYQRRRYRIPFKHCGTYFVLIPSAVAYVVLLTYFNAYITSCIPYNIVAVCNEYAVNSHEIAKERPRISRYARTADDSTTVVVVIGESMRPSNMSVNGYRRETTPNLKRHNVISFDNVLTDYCFTNESVAHILTRSDATHPDRAYTERSFIDVFKQSGITTAVITNQDIEKQYAYAMNEADTVINLNGGKWKYNFNKRLDGDIIPHYARLLDKHRRQLMVVHTIGSHWWYPTHYTSEFEVFKPVIQSAIVSECDSMALVNSYDNTILYTDHVLGQLIGLLSNRKAILLYLSDHGEPLGEGGCWLHAFEVDITHHTASFVWMSDDYRRAHPDRYLATVANRHNPYKTDYLYHTAIQAANIECDLLDSTKTIFATNNKSL